MHHRNVPLSNYTDDLEVALVTMSNISMLYGRLNEKQRTALLQVLLKKIIVDPEGEIVSHELHSPFAFLSTLATDLFWGKDVGGSGWVYESTPMRTRTSVFSSGG